MSVAIFLKNNLTNIHPVIGKVIKIFPYDYRPGIGSVYRLRKSEIVQYEASSIEVGQHFIFQRMKAMVDFAYYNVPAYTDYYDSKGFHPDAPLVLMI